MIEQDGSSPPVSHFLAEWQHGMTARGDLAFNCKVNKQMDILAQNKSNGAWCCPCGWSLVGELHFGLNRVQQNAVMMATDAYVDGYPGFFESRAACRNDEANFQNSSIGK